MCLRREPGDRVEPQLAGDMRRHQSDKAHRPDSSVAAPVNNAVASNNIIRAMATGMPSAAAVSQPSGRIRSQRKANGNENRRCDQR